MTPEAAAFVLAGGESSRMGTDKALVELGGMPLIRWPLEALRALGLDPVIAGARAPLAGYAPVLPDAGPSASPSSSPSSSQGPLSGICAALAHTPAARAVFVAVDTPLVPAALLQVMLDDARLSGALVTLASAAGRAETFPAVVDRVALPVLEERLEAGDDRGCLSAFRAAACALGRPLRILPGELLAQAGRVTEADGIAPAFWFLNVNRPRDLERAGAILSRYRPRYTTRSRPGIA